MPAYTYIGDDISISIRGVTFPAGEAVQVDDEDMQAKLDPLPFFVSDKPDASGETDPKDKKIAELTAKVASLEAELAETVMAPQEPEPPVTEVPVEPVSELEEDAETADTAPAEPTTDIPEDWRDMQWKRKMVLAKNFTTEPIENGGDADTAIELELMRRGNE